MALRLEMPAEAEYRGVAAGYEFVSEHGETVPVAPKLKFEVEQSDGDVALLPLSQSGLDRATPPFDAATLKKGDRVVLDLLVCWKGAEPKGDSYVQVLGCRRASASGLKAA
jgi:hypothetical protein